MKNIAAAFVAAQKDFNPAIKDATNPHFRSKYADLAACVNAVIDALNANGIALIQKTHESDNGVIVETVFVHESGETMDCGRLHVPADKQNPQGYGAALTYARRYSLMASCGIAPEDDDGNSASKPVSGQQAANIQALAEEVGVPLDRICEKLSVSSIDNKVARNGLIGVVSGAWPARRPLSWVSRLTATPTRSAKTSRESVKDSKTRLCHTVTSRKSMRASITKQLTPA